MRAFLLKEKASYFNVYLLGICIACVIYFGQISFVAAANTLIHKRYNIDFDAFGGYGSTETEALVNPQIQAVDIMMDWAAVESEAGVYNFAKADAVAKAWQEAGKKFVIVIRYTNEAPHNCSKKQNLPHWEMRRIRWFCDAYFGNIIPDYFDPVFKRDLSTFVNAVADHFANSVFKSSLLYVRVGVGLGSEGFYLTPCRRNQACDFERSKAQLVQWGWSPSNWSMWQKEMLSNFKKSFHYTTVIYPVVRLDIDTATGNSIQRDVAIWAVKNGLGLGALGLSPRFADGPARIREIFSEARALKPDVFIQLQTVRPVADLDEMAKDVSLAGQLGASAIEWYSDDVIYEQYQPYFEQWIKW